MKKLNKTGFSLIELIIVITIIGVLSAIGIPSYLRHVTKTRRAQALLYLTQMQGNYESYYVQNNGYPPSNSFLPKLESTSAYYTFSSTTTSTTYKLTATAIAKTKQDKDTEQGQNCSVLNLDNLGNKTDAANNSNSLCWGN